jgi:hypothetical protein
MRTT